MQRIQNLQQNKKASKIESLLICNPKMVRQVDYRWNHLVSSLYVMYRKLADLGIIITGVGTYTSRDETRNP